MAERIFERGLCLPSGSSLTDAEVDRIVELVRAVPPTRTGSRTGTQARPDYGRTWRQVRAEA